MNYIFIIYCLSRQITVCLGWCKVLDNVGHAGQDYLLINIISECYCKHASIRLNVKYKKAFLDSCMWLHTVPFHLTMLWSVFWRAVFYRLCSHHKNRVDFANCTLLQNICCLATSHVHARGVE